MRLAAALAFIAVFLSLPPLPAAEPQFVFPLIQGHGGVVSLPAAAEKPRPEAKIVFDITAESKPADVSRGLESVARYLNLHALGSNDPKQLQLALVLHGGATRCALSDAAYHQQTQETRNPNLPLIRELRKHGVEVFVCGQSLSRNKFPASDVAPELAIAESAMTVNVNKQLDGYAYLAIH
jgi:intracellular sulfur oxidation DsrE/DsrF family protein